MISNDIDGSGVLSLKSDDLSLSLGLTGALISRELLRLRLANHSLFNGVVSWEWTQ